MPRGHRIPNRIRRQIGADYAKGTPVRKIMEKYGVSKGSVYNIVRRKRGAQKPSVETTNAVVSLNFRGYDDVTISRMTGIPQATVHWHRTKQGLPVVPADRKRT